MRCEGEARTMMVEQTYINQCPRSLLRWAMYKGIDSDACSLRSSDVCVGETFYSHDLVLTLVATCVYRYRAK